jgi:uncharacterized membrane protein YgdD (TMEM256/DUF423 family)
MERAAVAAGAISAGLAVAMGAFGAHALRERLGPQMLAVFETGVRYQFYHALSLLLVGILAGRWGSSGLLSAVVFLFVLGMILFSGSLYLLTLTGVRWFGAVTPVGGVAFLAGWGCIVAAALGRR